MAVARDIRAGAAYVELYAKDNRLIRGLDRASRRLKAFGAGISQLGMKVAALGAAMNAAMGAAVKVFADAGDALDKMSRRTGFSVEALSGLGYAAKIAGTSTESLEKGIRRMQMTINDAGRELSTAEDALTDLGLSYENLKNLKPQEQFLLIADRLDKIENTSKKAAVSMMIFGRAGTQLLPMIEGGAASIQKMIDRARELGLIMSTEDAQAAADFTDRLGELWDVLKMSAIHIGASLVGDLKQLVKWFTRTVISLNKWIKDNRELIVQVAKITSIVLAAGIVLMVLGGAIWGLGAALGVVSTIAAAFGTAIGVIGSALAAILSPIGLIVTALAGLGAYLTYTSGVGGKALSWLGEQFNRLKTIIGDVMGGIVNAMKAGDIKLAAKILWLGIKLAWIKGIEVIMKPFRTFKRDVLLVWYSLGHGLKEFWYGVVNVLKSIWVDFSAWFRNITNKISNWVAKQIIAVQGLVGILTDEQVAAAQKGVEESAQIRAERIENERARKQRESAAKYQKQLTDEQAAYESKLVEVSQTFDKKISDANDELAKAQKELAKSIKDAADAAVTVAESGGPGALARPPRPPPVDDILKKTDVVGTFSAEAVFGLGVNTAADRTARATEETAKSNKEILGEMRLGYAWQTFS